MEVFTGPLEDGGNQVPVPGVGVDGLVDFGKLHVQPLGKNKKVKFYCQSFFRGLIATKVNKAPLERKY